MKPNTYFIGATITLASIIVMGILFFANDSEQTKEKLIEQRATIQQKTKPVPLQDTGLVKSQQAVTLRGLPGLNKPANKVQSNKQDSLDKPSTIQPINDSMTRDYVLVGALPSKVQEKQDLTMGYQLKKPIDIAALVQKRADVKLGKPVSFTLHKEPKQIPGLEFSDKRGQQ